MRFRFFLLSLAVLALPGCAKFLDAFSRLKGGTTQVSFARSRHGQKQAASSLAGGLILYAVGADSGFRQSFRFRSEAELASASVTLPYGNYNFYLVGFLAPNMTGGARCGWSSSGAVEALTSPTKDVYLDVSYEICRQAPFSPSASFADTIGSAGVRALGFVSCSPDANLASKNEYATCSNVVGSWSSSVSELKDERGYLHSGRSMQLSLNAYMPGASGPGAVSDSIKSACIAGSGAPGFGQLHVSSKASAAKAVAALDDRVLVFGTDVAASPDGGFFTSLDEGLTFPFSRLVTDPIGIFDISGSASFALAAGHDNFAGDTGGLFRSTDSGKTWVPVTGLPGGSSPGNFSRVSVGGGVATADGSAGLRLTLDAGASWNAISGTVLDGSGNGLMTYAGAVNPSDGHIFLAGIDASSGVDLRILESADGAHWSTYQTLTNTSGWATPVSLKIIDDVLYMDVQNGLLVLDSGTPTFICPTSATCDLPKLGDINITDYTVGPDGLLYIADYGGGRIDFGDPGDPSSWATTSFSDGSVIRLAGADTMVAAALDGCGVASCFRRSDVGSGNPFSTTSPSDKPYLPLGGSGGFLSTTISYYSDATCGAGGGDLLSEDRFDNGLYGAPSDVATSYASGSPGMDTRVFLHR